MEINLQETPCHRLELDEDESLLIRNMDTNLHETPRRRLEFDQDEGLKLPSVDDETIELLHSRISKESIPRIGMEFETIDAAYDFYNAYALAVGFSVRKKGGHKIKGVMLDMTFVCSCEGKRGYDKRDEVYKNHRVETRFGCLAMLKVSCRQIGKYRVVKFKAEHNHNLASPSKAHLFRSHRKISASQAFEVDLAAASGIAPKNAYEFMARQAGGRENLGFIEEDYRNYLRNKRSLEIAARDTGGVLKYLQGMRIADPNFFYALQLDADDLITNIFWADSKMMADYEDFGDVVCFDTTYRKHKDGRPIALFVGVNHHKQTTIFGAALLYDETADSFAWLFDTFSKAMGEKLPMTMLTDQDAAMSKALASQWPHTYHRLCIWHIFQNAATHLASVFAKHKEFSTDFSSCIYEYEYEEEFLDAWGTMLEKYELQDNDWLNRLFNIREKWALVYGRETFCADMTTTQRSESMNNVIKHYVSTKDDLTRFFENFQRLVDDRRYREMVADFKASQSRIVPIFPAAILKQASSIYTPAVYLLFQEELGKAYDCLIEVCGEMESLVEYKVTPPMESYNFLVTFDSKEKIVCCTCRKFQFAGLLCMHVLKVFSYRGIMEIPERYVLKRWTRDAKRGVRATNETLNAEIDPKEMMGKHYRELCRLSTRLLTRSTEHIDGVMLVKEGLLNLLKELDLSSTKRTVESSLQSTDIGKERDPNNHTVLNENGMLKKIRGIKQKPKTGGSTKRRLSALEKAKNKIRKPKSKGKQPAESSNVTQEMQIVQLSEISSNQSAEAYCPPIVCGYNYSIPLEYGQGGMYIGPSLSQPNQDFSSSYMTLLTSIGVPQALKSQTMINAQDNNS